MTRHETDHPQSAAKIEMVSSNATERKQSPAIEAAPPSPLGLEPIHAVEVLPSFIPRLREMIDAEVSRGVSPSHLDQVLSPQARYGPMFDLD